MIQTDLFISYSDFELGVSLHFPYREVINYIVQIPSKYDVIQLSNIGVYVTNNGSEVIFTFSDSAENEVCYAEYTGIEDKDKDKYTLILFDSTTDSYCGCMEINFNFYSWMRALPVGDLPINPGAVILHPGKYFYYNSDNMYGLSDVRFTYNGEPVNRISFPGFLSNIDGGIAKEESDNGYDSVNSYVNHFVLRDSNYNTYSVYGPDISLFLSSKSSNVDTRIVVTPGTVTITDF